MTPEEIEENRKRAQQARADAEARAQQYSQQAAGALGVQADAAVARGNEAGALINGDATQMAQLAAKARKPYEDGTALLNQSQGTRSRDYAYSQGAIDTYFAKAAAAAPMMAQLAARRSGGGGGGGGGGDGLTFDQQMKVNEKNKAAKLDELYGQALLQQQQAAQQQGANQTKAAELGRKKKKIAPTQGVKTRVKNLAANFTNLGTTLAAESSLKGAVQRSGQLELAKSRAAAGAKAGNRGNIPAHAANRARTQTRSTNALEQQLAEITARRKASQKVMSDERASVRDEAPAMRSRADLAKQIRELSAPIREANVLPEELAYEMALAEGYDPAEAIMAFQAPYGLDPKQRLDYARSEEDQDMQRQQFDWALQDREQFGGMTPDQAYEQSLRSDPGIQAVLQKSIVDGRIDPVRLEQEANAAGVPTDVYLYLMEKYAQP
jgi:hypothetical protein